MQSSDASAKPDDKGPPQDTPDRRSLPQLARRAVQVVMQRLWARWSLRQSNDLGADVRVVGRMRFENRGHVGIGRKVSITSTFLPVEILTSRTGSVTIGSGVWINFGVVIAAHSSIVIGDRVMIGQHCIISDVDFPEADALPGADPPRPISIGAGVWLAGRVTVRPGVSIGNGTVVISGSIVDSDLPPNTICGGVPARPLMRVRQAALDQPQAG
jgi:acetyltransferase-like isoleucine patch superfamily enzyme